jgi:hypothetical protein
MLLILPVKVSLVASHIGFCCCRNQLAPGTSSDGLGIPKGADERKGQLESESERRNGVRVGFLRRLAPAATPIWIDTRRAQSLYCATGLAKRRNKAIAPYALKFAGGWFNAELFMARPKGNAEYDNE